MFSNIFVCFLFFVVMFSDSEFVVGSVVTLVEMEVGAGTFDCSATKSATILLWYHGAMVPGYPGTMVP